MHPLCVRWKDHCARYGFEWKESDPLVSRNPKLLFNISGGVSFEEAISFGHVPERRSIASAQDCLRTDGWGRVGLTDRHHFAFSMLGHFLLHAFPEIESKTLMIEIAWTFLTRKVGLDGHRLSVTVHPYDYVTQEIWSRYGIAVIVKEGNTTLTPQRTRCGFRTEILWQQVIGNSIELWNLVFTQFEGDKLLGKPLMTIVCDSGASLDRIVTAQEELVSDYDNSDWKDLVDRLGSHALSPQPQWICRLADLGKASFMLINEGLEPSNKVAGYVLRRLIRDAYVTCRLVSLPFASFCNYSLDWWLSDSRNAEKIQQVLASEVAKFEESLARGRKEFYRLKRMRGGALLSEDFERLASTYGYPKALIELEMVEICDGEKR